MKFIFTNCSEKSDVNLQDFLFSVYSQQNLLWFSSHTFSPVKKISPIYLNAADFITSRQHNLNKCAAQIKLLFNCLHATLRAHGSKITKELAAQALVLKGNICSQILGYDGYELKNKQNIERMCNQGKKYLEDICYTVKKSDLSNDIMLEKLSAFLNSDQIISCMGGVLTILQDAYSSLANDIESKIQFTCLNAVYADANHFIHKYKILYMYNDGDDDHSISVAAINNEIHYINALRNALACSHPFLGKIEDKHAALFPQKNGWLEKFVQEYDANTFIEYFVSSYVSNIVRPRYYEKDSYEILTQKLDCLGADKDFSLYDPEQPNCPLRDKDETILRCSIIKRMIDSGLVALDAEESVSKFNFEGTEYKLYTLGKPNMFWLEMLTSDGDIIFTPIENMLATLKQSSIFNHIELSQSVWEKLLLATASCNNIKLLKCAIAKVDNVNCTDQLGNTPLMVAIEHKHEIQMQYLLADNRTDRNKQNHRGKSPLMLAASMNYTYAVDLLLNENHHANQININAVNMQGFSALMLAASAGHKSSVDKLLLRSEVDVNIQSKWEGDTALMLALEYRHTNIVDCIISSEKVDSNKMDNYDSTLLMLAIIHDNYKLFKYLIDNNLCDINAKDFRGLTAMQIAIQHKRENYISMLAPKYDVEARESDGNITLLSINNTHEDNRNERKFNCSIQ